MSIIYSCDICKKKTKEVVIVMGARLKESSYRHFCSKCWASVEEFLKPKITHLQRHFA